MSAPLRTDYMGASLETQVARAKTLMGHGLTMTEAARAIGVLPADLDKALWRFLAVPAAEIAPRKHTRPEPMF